ncbi:potassium channel, subfamily K, member 16-like [Antedon mediterranea]|uniref:potassium channel, subfamily K, member 16-like n=1 Tax=Antedon mediterranea TaxID=105859 RepID=UPI003AF67BB4
MTLLKRLLILTFCFVLYLWFGALVFHLLEADNETQVRNDLVTFFTEFKQSHTCIESGELKELIKEVITATENGVFHDLKYDKDVNSSKLAPSEYMQWDIFNSFFFASTVVTTIGYGNLSPKTLWGRMFCILYALIGIPLTGWVLNVIGKCFVEKWKRLTNLIVSNFSLVVSSNRARTFTAYFAVGCLMYTLTIILPSLLFMLIEGWTFFEAQYFCLISLTTIGFGDYVICNNPEMSVVIRATYKCMAVVYLIFGLSILMITLKGIGDMETRNAKTFGNLSQKLKQQVLRASDKFKQRDEDNNHIHDDTNGIMESLPSSYRSTIYNQTPDGTTVITDQL